MKKILIPVLSLLTLIMSGTIISSCKKNETFVKPIVSFSGTKKTVEESAGSVQIEVDLDRAYSKDIKVTYSLAGTATDKDVATASSPGDYVINDNHGEVIIKKGETKGTIDITVINDTFFEADETIDLSIDNVDTNDVTISKDNSAYEIVIANDDDKVKPSFTLSTLSVFESDGLIEVEVKLDKAPGSDLTIAYDLSGTAKDSVSAKNTTPNPIPADYAIQNTPGQVKILAGQTTGKIQIGLYPDFYFENDETIKITFSATNTGVDISGANTMTITLKQEDGIALELDWDKSYTTVDMDLFLWIGSDPSSLQLTAISANDQTTPTSELVFIPAIISDASFGVSYVYYAGTENSMNFTATYANFTNSTLDTKDKWTVYNGTYTLNNINAWTTVSGVVTREQTFDMAGGVLKNFSAIVTPSSSSRARTFKLPSGTQKTKGLSSLLLMR